MYFCYINFHLRFVSVESVIFEVLGQISFESMVDPEKLDYMDDQADQNTN